MQIRLHNIFKPMFTYFGIEARKWSPNAHPGAANVINQRGGKQLCRFMATTVAVVVGDHNLELL